MSKRRGTPINKMLFLAGKGSGKNTVSNYKEYQADTSDYITRI